MSEERGMTLEDLEEILLRQPSPGVADPDLDPHIIEILPEERDLLVGLAKKGLKAQEMAEMLREL